MAPQSWLSEIRRTYCESFLPEYSECRVKKRYKQFWLKLFAGYLTMFPLVEDTFPGLKLGDLNDEQMGQYSIALGKLQKRLKEWFRWQFNPRSRNNTVSVSPKLLKEIYVPRTRGLKAYEAFAKLYPEKVSAALEERCEKDGIEKSKKVSRWHGVCKELYNNATEEEIQAVEERIADDAEEEEEGEDGEPETYHRFLTSLPSVLSAVVDPAVRKAGVLAVVTIVGPEPASDGQIKVHTLQFGDKDKTPLFAATWNEYERVFVTALSQFAKRHEFLPELCAQRALNKDVRASGSQGLSATKEASPNSIPSMNPPVPAPTVSTTSTETNTPKSIPHPQSNSSNLLSTLPNLPKTIETSQGAGVEHGDSASPAFANHPNAGSTAINGSGAEIGLLRSAFPNRGDSNSSTVGAQNSFASQSLSSSSSALSSSSSAFPNQAIDNGGDFPCPMSNLFPFPDHTAPSNGSAASWCDINLHQAGVSIQIPPSQTATWDVSMGNMTANWKDDPMFAGTAGDLTSQDSSYRNNRLASHNHLLPPVNDFDTEPEFDMSALGQERESEPEGVNPSYRPGSALDAALKLWDERAKAKEPSVRTKNSTVNRHQCALDTASKSVDTSFPAPKIFSSVNLHELPDQSASVNRGASDANSVPKVGIPANSSVNRSSPLTRSTTVTTTSQVLFDITNSIPDTSLTSSLNPATNADITVPNRENIPPGVNLSASVSASGSHSSRGEAHTSSTDVIPLTQTQWVNPTPVAKPQLALNASPHVEAPSHNADVQIEKPAPNANPHIKEPAPVANPVANAVIKNPAPIASPSIGAPSRSADVQIEKPTPNANPHIKAPIANPHVEKPAPVAKSSAAKPAPATSTSDVNAASLPEEDTSRRRSARPAKPSTQREKQQLIGSNIPQTSRPCPVGDEQDADKEPEWFANAVADLRNAELGIEWLGLVDKWCALESSLGFGKSLKGSLPVQDRPAEWSKWTTKSSKGARNHVAPPFIDDPAEIGIAIVKWWCRCQPAFRLNPGEVLPLPVYAGPDPNVNMSAWAPLCKSGPNGLISLLVLILWWGRAAAGGPTCYRDDSRDSWRALVLDVSRTFDELSVVAPNLKNRGVKRRCETQPTRTTQKRARP